MLSGQWLDWAARIWGWVPDMAKAAAVTALSAALGMIQGLPYQAVLLIAVWTLGGAIWLVLAINEAFSVAQQGDAKKKHILNKLGDFVNRYERLERECLSTAGSDEFSKKQTAAFVAVDSFLSSALDNGYAGQFKAAAKEPLEIPAGYPSGKRYLLFQIHGRKEWLNRLIDEVRASKKERP